MLVLDIILYLIIDLIVCSSRASPELTKLLLSYCKDSECRKNPHSFTFSYFVTLRTRSNIGILFFFNLQKEPILTWQKCAQIICVGFLTCLLITVTRLKVGHILDIL